MLMKTVAIALMLAMAGGAVNAANFHMPATAAVELQAMTVDDALLDRLAVAPIRHTVISEVPRWELVSSFTVPVPLLN